jgi:hypothetical protein
MNERERREQIVAKWMENTQRPNHFIARDLKIPRRTVDTVLKRYLETLSTAQKPRTVEHGGARDPGLDRKIIKTICKNRSMSERDIAKKNSTSQSMVRRAKERASMKTKKKRKVPKTSEKQRCTIKTRARKLYDLLGTENFHLILDDETYVKADFSTLPGDQFYTIADGETLPDSETTIGMEKFGSKYLVWQAICPCGDRSRTYVTTGTINKNIYINECLKKRLLPFIQKHNNSALFWPDLATAHYAKDTLNFLKQNDIQIVPKALNPPNIPQCRPIERYWALVKGILRKTGKTASNQQDFLRKWNSACKKVANDTVAGLMEGIRQKLRQEWEKK